MNRFWCIFNGHCTDSINKPLYSILQFTISFILALGNSTSHYCPSTVLDRRQINLFFWLVIIIINCVFSYLYCLYYFYMQRRYDSITPYYQKILRSRCSIVSFLGNIMSTNQCVFLSFCLLLLYYLSFEWRFLITRWP